jgi:hypothetical protein
MEKRDFEQRCAINFCLKLNENPTETYKKLKNAYGEHAVSRTRVFRWHKAFLDSLESVEDEPRPGRHCTAKTEENVTKVRSVVRSDRRLTVRTISSVKHLNHQTAIDICTEVMDMRTFGCCITTTLPVTLKFSWAKFWPRRVLQWFYSPKLTWSESVWLLPFPETKI